MYDERIKDIVEKVADQINGDWIDAWNYLENFGVEGLNLTEKEKEIFREHIGKSERTLTIRMKGKLRSSFCRR